MGAKAKDPITEKVDKYFSDNPKKKVVHTTSDGFLFETRKWAADHAATLEPALDPVAHKNPNFIEVKEDSEEEEETE